MTVIAVILLGVIGVGAVSVASAPLLADLLDARAEAREAATQPAAAQRQHGPDATLLGRRPAADDVFGTYPRLRHPEQVWRESPTSPFRTVEMTDLMVTEERCRLTELITSQCAHCKGVTAPAWLAEYRAELLRQPGWLTATSGGRCSVCREDYSAGAAIHVLPGRPWAGEGARRVAECCAEEVHRG